MFVYGYAQPIYALLFILTQERVHHQKKTY